MQCGNKCPGINEYHTFESGYCLNSCDHQCVPASVLVHIQGAQRRDKHKGRYLSVTALLGCLRALYLERTIDYYVEPPKSWWSLRGKLLHALLENPGNAHIPNWQSETEYEWFTGLWWNPRSKTITTTPEGPDSEPIILYGTIDVLRTETGEMYDYKTIGDNGLAYIKDGAKPDHVKQFNIYRLLVERGHPKGKPDYKPIKINKIVAFYMTMMKVVRTGGLLTETSIWRESEPPEHPSMAGKPEVIAEREHMALKRGKRKATATPEDYDLKIQRRFKITYAIPEVPLTDLDELCNFIRENIVLLVRGFELAEMPPACSMEMRLWRCENYCPDQIRNACDEQFRKDGEVRIPKTLEAAEIGYENNS
jgi:hypothetical protein